MANNCKCFGEPGNTGVPNTGVARFEKTSGLFVQAKFDSNGARNSMPNATSDFAQWFTDRINDADPLARLYPIQKIKEITQEREESVTRDFADGASVKVRQGAKPFTGQKIGTDSVEFGKLEQNECLEIVVWKIDACGAVQGKIEGDDRTSDLYGIDVEPGTWDPIYQEATDADVLLTNINFQYGINEKDSNLRMLTCDQLGTFNALEADGLLDVRSTVGAVTVDDVQVTLELCYGSYNDILPFTGFKASLEVNNITTGTPVAVTLGTVDESPNGTYDINFSASQPSGTYEIVLASALTGYDLETTTFVIP